jgi:hypothetical protein
MMGTVTALPREGPSDSCWVVQLETTMVRLREYRLVGPSESCWIVQLGTTTVRLRGYRLVQMWDMVMAAQMDSL